MSENDREYFKKEQVRLASDAMLNGTWHGLARHVYPSPAPDLRTHPLASEADLADLEAARERARLSVLNLTDRDKRFLRAMKVAF